MRRPVNIESCACGCMIMEYHQSFKAIVCLIYIIQTVYTIYSIFIKQSLKREIGLVKTTGKCCEVIILYQLIFLREEHNDFQPELFTQNLHIKLIMYDFKVLRNHSKTTLASRILKCTVKVFHTLLLFMKLFRY